jgi:hypothetical protein
LIEKAEWSFQDLHMALEMINLAVAIWVNFGHLNQVEAARIAGKLPVKFETAYIVSRHRVYNFKKPWFQSNGPQTRMDARPVFTTLVTCLRL